MKFWPNHHTFRKVVVETNIFDVAIGLAVAGVFVKLVNAFVTYVLTPPIGALIKGKSLANFELSMKFLNGNEPVLFRYGMFLDAFVEFILVAVVVYWAARLLLKIKKTGEKRVKNCTYCCMSIPKKAQKCPFCQSNIS
ncbi:MAG: Large-conductance mechanosensitive channel [Chlamydiales bacterium]|nr:Large-conductance mechanosensitive channel [Chlamydiales bacterium]